MSLALLLLLTLPGGSLADYQPAEVYVVCNLGLWVEAILAAEFAIDHLPGAAMAQVTEHWNTQLVIGKLETGIALAFQEPLAGPLAVLGRLEFIAWQPFPSDYVIDVVEDSWGVLKVVDADGAEEIQVLGGRHTFNCSNWCDCHLGSPSIGLYTDEAASACCQDIDVFTPLASEGSWGALKSLY